MSWSGDRGGITTVVIQEGAEDAKIDSKSMDYLFAGLTRCTDIQGLENINTSNTVSMKYAFQNDSSLEELDLTTFTSQRVADATGMFDTCSKLRRV